MCSAFANEHFHLVNNFALFGVGPVLLPSLPVAGGHLHLTRIKITKKLFFFTEVTMKPSHAIVGKKLLWGKNVWEKMCGKKL